MYIFSKYTVQYCSWYCLMEFNGLKESYQIHKFVITG